MQNNRSHTIVRVNRTTGIRLLGLLGLLLAAPALSLAEPVAVKWQPWTETVLNSAKTSGRPVYVLIGSDLSELSRTTLEQTLTTPAHAELLNENFLCIHVERDEHVALAAAAQYYLRTLKQMSGWPVHVWLTPELQPFEGASYLPPTEEWGKPGFGKVAAQVVATWSADASAARQSAEAAVAALADPFVPAPAAPDAAEIKAGIDAAETAWIATFDPEQAGFGDAPRAPEPELIRALLRHDSSQGAPAVATLRAMAASALRDPLDGGFFRNTVDRAGHLPTFQKTLSDQARLALAYLDAARLTGDRAFETPARGALDFALQFLAAPTGGYFSAIDATDEAHAGYYAFTAAEIDAALGAGAAAFKAAHAVESGGNIGEGEDPSGQFKGRNILRASPAADSPFAAAAAKLLALRGQRPPVRPARAAIAADHGLLLQALARAAGQLTEPRYAKAADELSTFIARELVRSTGELRRLPGSDALASPGDYFAVALGCRELGHARQRNDSNQLADRLVARALETYFDSASGRFFASPAQLAPGVFVRAPALREGLSAESLALLAGVPEPARSAIVAAQSVLLTEEGSLVPGDVLLSLAP